MTLLLAASGHSAKAQLPAPPLPVVQTLAAELTKDFNSGRLDAYGSYFADDLHVYENGREIAPNKAAWLNIVSQRSKHQKSVVREVNEATLSLLIVDTVSTMDDAPKPNTVVECCTFGRATLYTLRSADDKIIQVQSLINDPGYW